MKLAYRACLLLCLTTTLMGSTFRLSSICSACHIASKVIAITWRTFPVDIFPNRQPIGGSLLCGPYESTQFYTTILPIRNGLAVAVKT
jgi:hypothetical protein